MTFLGAYLNGLTEYSKLDDWIRYWRTDDDGCELREFLGFSIKEYEYLLRVDDDQGKAFIDMTYKKQSEKGRYSV